MGELEGRSSPEEDVLRLVGLCQDHLMVCLIVLPMRVRILVNYLYIASWV